MTRSDKTTYILGGLSILFAVLSIIIAMHTIEQNRETERIIEETNRLNLETVRTLEQIGED